ncbi:MAG TPA: alpha/beta hydrolase [Acidimicrobiia bacterium]|nr:alpha/beta hydrolase [Acidimicrobiia bacterium]
MRAAYPNTASLVDRDGAEIAYEIYGAGEPTILMIPPSPITHSRIYKGQIPYLSRHFRVVTFDGRGNGRSGRPVGIASHTRAANVADAVAVLDASGTDRAILMAHCHANWWAVELAAQHPERVEGLIAIEPGVPYVGHPEPHWQASGEYWNLVLDDPQGWQLYNRHTITNDHRAWVEFFFGAQLVESHSTKVYDDAVAWALESTGEILADSEEAQDLDLPTRDVFRAVLAGLELPVLVIHGDHDVCQDVTRGRELAELTGGEYVELKGSGHLALARDPVRVNHAIKRFVDRVGRAR